MNNKYLPDNLIHDASWIYPLASSLSLSGERFQAILQSLGVVPDKHAWHQWLTLLLLGLGSGLLLTGVVFFFAYNWEAMHRFTRFGVLTGGVVISALTAFGLGIDKLPGKLALTAASVLTGVLLATFGMVYQTGADSYLFFTSWAIAILPWVVVSRFQPLYLIALIVANIAIIMWGDTRFRGFDLFGQYTWQITGALFLLNASVLVLREMTSLLHAPVITGRWFPRVIALWMMAFLSISILQAIWKQTVLSTPSLLVLYIGTLALFTLYYLFVRRDLFVLALVLGSLIMTSTSLISEHLSSYNGFPSMLLIIGLYITGTTAAAAHGLRTLSQHWQKQEVAS